LNSLILDCYVNLHFNYDANTLINSKLHESKATVINDILNMITKFSVNHEKFKEYLAFAQSLIPIKEFRTYIYKTKMLETIEDTFIDSNLPFR
jgi:hypothetical protein